MTTTLPGGNVGDKDDGNDDVDDYDQWRIFRILKREATFSLATSARTKGPSPNYDFQFFPIVKMFFCQGGMAQCPLNTPLIWTRGIISTFSWGGPNFFYIFQCHRTIEKLEKNSTLYVVIWRYS